MSGLRSTVWVSRFRVGLRTGCAARAFEGPGCWERYADLVSGFGVQGLESRVWGLGFGLQGLGFRVCG